MKNMFNVTTVLPHKLLQTNARVRLQEVVRQNGGHIEHVLH